MKELATALAQAQSEIKHAVKDSSNPAFGKASKYADLASVWEACRPALTKHGLSIAQTTDFEGGEVWLRTILLHKSGETIEGRYPLRPLKQDPQGFGSALTYARRYCIAALVGVVADDDDDGNLASQRSNGTGAQQAPAQARQAEPRGSAPEPTDSPVAAFLKGKNLTIPVPGARAGKPDLLTWAQSMGQAIDACQDLRTLDNLWAANSGNLADLQKINVPERVALEQRGDVRRGQLAPAIAAE